MRNKSELDLSSLDRQTLLLVKREATYFGLADLEEAISGIIERVRAMCDLSSAVHM